jgi:hypothetical protein
VHQRPIQRVREQREVQTTVAEHGGSKGDAHVIPTQPFRAKMPTGAPGELLDAYERTVEQHLLRPPLYQAY